LENLKKSPPEAKVSVTECSVEEVQNVAVTHPARSFESPVACIEEKTSDIFVHNTHRDEENVISVSADTVLSAETSEPTKNKVIVEREKEEHVKEICEKVEPQHFDRTSTERCHYEVNNQYQFGQLMSSCWQPIMRQEPCSDSESDLSESSSDASITDIIPMLDELNPPVNFETDHPLLWVLRRKYEWLGGGRGLGARRERALDAVLTAGGETAGTWRADARRQGERDNSISG